jgi:hypothetical protein
MGSAAAARCASSRIFCQRVSLNMIAASVIVAACDVLTLPFHRQI